MPLAPMGPAIPLDTSPSTTTPPSHDSDLEDDVSHGVEEGSDDDSDGFLILLPTSYFLQSLKRVQRFVSPVKAFGIIF